MLCLTRKTSEGITITVPHLGGIATIHVAVNSIGRGSVSLGVDAPKWVEIVRDELEETKGEKP
jgi:carbon storage regulator CsrA